MASAQIAITEAPQSKHAARRKKKKVKAEIVCDADPSLNDLD